MRQARIADALLDIADAKLSLARFDEARTALKEAWEIRCCIFGEDSIATAVCLCKMADSFGLQAHTYLRDIQCGDVQVNLENWHGDSSRMRVLTHRCSPRYEYPLVFDARIFVEAKQGRSKEYRHEFFTHTTVTLPESNKSQQVKTFTTQVERKPTRPTFRYLKDRQLLYCKMALAIFLEVLGVNRQYLSTDHHKPYVVLERKKEDVEREVAAKTEDSAAVETAIMRKALKIHQRVWGGDDPRISRYLENLEKSLPALARLNAPGVFVADLAHKEGMVTPLSSDDDEGNLAKLQSHIHRIHQRMRLPDLRRPAARRGDEKAQAMVQMLASLDAFNGGIGRLSSVSNAARLESRELCWRIAKTMTNN